VRSLSFHYRAIWLAGLMVSSFPRSNVHWTPIFQYGLRVNSLVTRSSTRVDIALNVTVLLVFCGAHESLIFDAVERCI
jgi:hypothetical protein